MPFKEPPPRSQPFRAASVLYRAARSCISTERNVKRCSFTRSLPFVDILDDNCTTEFQCTHSINFSRCWEGQCSCLSGYRRDIDLIDGTELSNSCIRRKQPRPRYVFLKISCELFSFFLIALGFSMFPSSFRQF